MTVDEPHSNTPDSILPGLDYDLLTAMNAGMVSGGVQSPPGLRRHRNLRGRPTVGGGHVGLPSPSHYSLHRRALDHGRYGSWGRRRRPLRVPRCTRGSSPNTLFTHFLINQPRGHTAAPAAAASRLTRGITGASRGETADLTAEGTFVPLGRTRGCISPVLATASKSTRTAAVGARRRICGAVAEHWCRGGASAARHCSRANRAPAYQWSRGGGAVAGRLPSSGGAVVDRRRDSVGAARRAVAEQRYCDR